MLLYFRIYTSNQSNLYKSRYDFFIGTSISKDTFLSNIYTLNRYTYAYGHIYTASVAMGANPGQTIKAFKEAESYNGPSIIIAYAPCDQHGIKGGLSNHQKVQKAAVECGYTTLYRFDPRKEKPLTVDSAEPNWDNFEAFLLNENRFKQLVALKGEEAAKKAFEKTKADAQKRYARLKALESQQ